MLTRSPLSESDRLELAKLLFPDADSLPTLEQIEQQYPSRNLPPSAMVTRVAPSPTGFAHIGMVYVSLINRILAQQSGGMFLLRVEDTDTNRAVAGALEMIIKTLQVFGLSPHEGLVPDADGTTTSRGAYGPYIQSERKPIYRAVAYQMVKSGVAYPCFTTAEELEKTAEEQRLSKARTGYYGRYATWRDASLESVKTELAAGKKPVIRLRSFGSLSERVTWNDTIRGTLKLPENDLDIVILKSDGQSLYHLAHLVDDHFMRITHVVRGDEWVSSVPVHLQIYEALGWTPPVFGHLSTIQKTEQVTETDPETGETKEKVIKRKLSKRKDPEASVEYYLKTGYPHTATCEYLLNIANSAFEDWRKSNLDKPYYEYPLRLDKCNPAGALADTVKLTDICKEYISRLPAEEVLRQGLAWASEHDQELYELITTHRDLALKALSVERGGAKPNKRLATWAGLREELAWALPPLFAERAEIFNSLPSAEGDRKEILRRFLATYNPADDKDLWFQKCKEIGAELGFAPEVKLFKQNPSAYKGHVGDVTMVLRVALCRAQQTPDLYEVMLVLGIDEVQRRFSRYL
jgi:glutamyl-tRNA synthetase